MSPLAGPVAAAAVIFPPGTRIPGVDDSKQLDVEQRDRLAPIIKQQAHRLGGRLRRGRGDRPHQHLLGRARGDAPRGARRWRRAAEHLLIDARRAARCRHAAAVDHRRRRQEPVDRRGVDPGQDGARRAHGGAGRGVSRATASPSTRATPCRAHCQRARAARGLRPSTADRSRRCARRWACRRCRLGRPVSSHARRSLDALPRPATHMAHVARRSPTCAPMSRNLLRK